MFKYFMLTLILAVCSHVSAAGPVSYPDGVNEMSDTEFYQWAMNRNQRAQDASDAEIAVNPPRYIYTPVGITKNGTDRRERYIREYQFPNPFYAAPKPLTLVNPFVRPQK